MSIDPVSNILPEYGFNHFDINSNPIEDIRRTIQNKGYSQATQDIVLIFKAQSNNTLPDDQIIQGAYSLLKDLLPYLNEEDFASLQDTIRKLLHLSQNFPDLQKELAIQLASIYVKKGDITSNVIHYLKAINYYLKDSPHLNEDNLASLQDTIRKFLYLSPDFTGLQKDLVTQLAHMKKIDITYNTTHYLQSSPNFNEDNFVLLQDTIRKLLNLSPDPQKDLATQLASIYVEKGNITSNASYYPQTMQDYLQAMHYYSKALKIGEEHNLEPDIHYIASHIFMKILQEHVINSQRIKEQLDLAKRKGDPEKFQSGLLDIDKLLKFRSLEEDDNTIKKLYRQAAEVFNSIKKASEERFSACGELITKRVLNALPPHEHPITECYLEAFYQFRAFFKNEFKKISNTSNYEKVRVFQKKVTNKLKVFFRDHLLNNAFAILGDPPCDCDLRAMGSLGREEVCPYSDLEWMILISNNQNEDRINQGSDKINQDKEIYQHISFFKTLANFIELQVVSLGETAATNFPVFTSLGTKNSSGFHIDTGGNPAQDDLIGSPEKMANLQIPINQDQDYDPRSTSHTMLKTISLYQTIPDLFDQYQKNIDAILDEELLEEEKISAPSVLTVRERKALKLIEKRFSDYKKAWNVHFEEHKIINIKEQYIEVLQHLISDLALFYGIKETNTMDIIDSLQIKQVFTKESSILLKEAISFIYMLRVRLHLEYKEQKEEAYINEQSEACTESQEAYIGHQEAYSQPQNDLHLLRLSFDEIEKLAEIYWLVIRPIFFKVSKSFNDELKKQFTKISLPETSLEESLWCEDELEAKKLIPLSQYLVKYYIKKNKPIEDHVDCYKKFSQKSIFESLRICYLKTLRKEKQFSIANTLIFIPNRNGLRRSHVEVYQKLQDSLRQITNNIPSSVLIKSPTLQKPLYLKPECVKQILDKDGNIKREYNNSLHRVCRLRNYSDIDLHFKQKPNHPLMEYAIHDLTSRLTGEETPPSELLRFEVTLNGKTKVYPVLVSQTILGKNLKEVLSGNPRYKPDPKCLTRMLLNAICIRPGDGRASNFVVNNDQLYCIDNDVAFVEPIVRDVIFRNTNFCSILFCLENQLLDTEILQKFISIDIDLIFASWLEGLVKKEELYLTLFVKEEKQLYEEDPENKFTPTILLPAGMVTTLYAQIHILQQFLKHSLNDQLLSIDLLDKLITLKGEDGTTSQIGGRIYKQYKDARSLLSPEARLKKATNRRAEQSLTTKQAMKASLGKTPTIEEIQKREKFSLKQAQEEFMGYSLFEGGITLSIQGEKQALSANFEKIVQGKKPDIERQSLMLKGLDLVFSYQKNKPTSITLTNCAVLNNKKLSPFLHQDLKYLDLRYSLVKADMVETISSYCPNLQELYLSECDQLQALENWGVIFSDPLNFSQLEALHIARCNNLERLKINAPKLRDLKANNNIKLEEVDVETINLVELNIDSCPLLTRAIFKDKAFGKKEWERYFGDVGIEPPLPANIEKILNEPCSFWPDKKVKETHLLVLIPNTVNGKPFTMNYLGELIQKPKSGHSTKYKYYSDYIKEAVGDKSYPSHWLLMTRDIIPGSKYKGYSKCSDMIANHRRKTGKPYELPYLLEATASILMHYVKTGERLYPNDPWTYTFSQDVNKAKDSLGVGGFVAGGLFVDYDYGVLGVVSCRKF